MKKFEFQGLDQPIEADWPVTITVPLDGGKVEKRHFTARFRLLRPSEIPEIAKAETAGAEYETQRRYWVGFGRGEEQDLTPELFAQLMDLTYFRNGLQAAYSNFANGIEVKN